MTEQTQTLEQAQAATVEAMMAKNRVEAKHKASRARCKLADADELKPFSKAINVAVNAENKIRRAQAKAAANEAADEAAAEAKREADDAKAEFRDACEGTD